MDKGFPTVAGWWKLSVRRGFSSARQLFSTALITATLIVALGVPIVLASKAVSAQQAGAGSQLNTLRVDVPAASDEGGLTRATLDWIAGIPGVSFVVMDFKVAIYGDADQMWDANVQVLRPWMLPPGVSTQQIEGDQVIVPDEIDGVPMSKYVGMTLPISHVRAIDQSTGEQVSSDVQVVATYPANWSGYGQEVVLASEELAIKLQATRFGYTPSDLVERIGVEGAWVQVDTVEHLDSVASEIRAKGYDVSAERDRLGTLPGVLAAFPIFLGVVGISTLFLLVARVFSSVKASLTHRTREFGLLRMRGYSVADIQQLVCLESITGVSAGAIVGSLIGLALGLWLSANLIPAELGVPTGWTAVPAPLLLIGTTILGISAFSLLTGLLAVRHILRQDPFLMVMRRQ